MPKMRTMVDPMIEDEREERLAAWAQEKISRLRHLVTLMEEHLAEARLAQAPEGTDTYLAEGTRRDEVRLPKGANIRFVTGDRDLVDYVDIRVKQEFVNREVRQVVQIMGGSQISVKPLSGNLVYITTEA